MPKTHSELMQGFVDWLDTNLDSEIKADMEYIGKVPAINSREDYKNYIPSKLPMIGVASPNIDYGTNYTMGVNYPIRTVQFIYAARVPGNEPGEDEDVTQAITQELETIFLATLRDGGDMFGMANDISDGKLLNLMTFPSFYTSIDSNRKAFAIGYFTVELNLAAI